MPRQTRMESAGAFYHVLNRGNYRQEVFTVGQSGEQFERTLFEACGRFGWRLHAYVLMSNHYHLALETPEPNLAVGMQWLQSTFANRFNRIVQERGHVFQGRFKSLVVEDVSALLAVVNYIHLNPVRAGHVTVADLRDYAMSSFPKYFWGKDQASGMPVQCRMAFRGRAIEADIKGDALLPSLPGPSGGGRSTPARAVVSAAVSGLVHRDARGQAVLPGSLAGGWSFRSGGQRATGVRRRCG